MDVTELLPNMLFIRLLLILCILIVLPFAALLFFSTALGVDSPADTIVTGLFALVLLAVPSVALWLSRRQRRAAGLVVQNPRVLGSIRGILSPRGYERQGPQQPETIPWSAFRVIDVRSKGIRLQIRSDDARFIALPAHCFEAYDQRQIRMAIDGFRSAQRVETDPAADAISMPIDWSNPPNDAIRFAGIITWLDQTRLVIPRRHLVDPQQWASMLQTADAGYAAADDGLRSAPATSEGSR